MRQEAERTRTNLYFALIGFGSGAIVGAAVALLFAPASGKQERAAIKERWDDFSDKASEVYGGAKDAVSSAYEKTTAAVGRARDRISVSE